MTAASPLAKLARREPRAGDRLPYARHLDASTIELRDGALMQMVQVEGFAFETADSDTLNHLHAVRDVVLRGVGGAHIVLYCHVNRRRVAADLAGRFEPGAAADIDAQWRARLAQKRLYVNDIILTLLRRPPVGKVGMIERMGNGLRRMRSSEDRATAHAKARRELDAARINLIASLGRYRPRLLSLQQGSAGTYSEPLESLSALYNGDSQPVLQPTGDCGQYIPYKRVSFGLDTIEFRGAGAGDIKFGAIISVKEYPATTTPGILDNLLRLPHEIALSESFAFIDRQIADERISLALRRLRAASDETTTLRQGLLAAKDDLAAGAAAYGEHHLTVLVRAASLDALDRAAAEVQSALADVGAIAVREDLNLEPAFWAQFPGNGEYIARRALISTGNFAGLASLHGFPVGEPAGGPWGEPVTVLETTSATPYFFNFHKGDLGNFTLIGPSGSGKTVVLNFLIAQAQKYQPTTFFFDKDRGAEIFIRAIGGVYNVLRPGEPSGFNPLLLPDNAANRAFLKRFLTRLVEPQGGSLSPDELAIVSDAIDSNFDQRPEHRRLRFLVELLSGGSRPTRADLAARLAPWINSGERAWLFDNERDEVRAKIRTSGFDMTALLDAPALRTPAMMYLFHRVEERLDGRPALIVIDEGWKALDDDAFIARLKDWMKTVRKRNGVVGFATQSASDALESRIASTIIEQAATQMFMSNAKAQASEYCDGFGLTAHELELVRSLPEHLRCVLIKQGGSSVVARLDMDDMPDAIAVLSGREASVRLLDRIRAKVGDDPRNWLPVFLRTQRGAKS